MTPAFAGDSLQPILAHLYLGYTLKQVQKVFPPATARAWKEETDPKGRVHRYRVHRAELRHPDPRIETLVLTFKKRHLVDVQLIYDAASTRDDSVDQRAGEWALIYGEPQREDSGAFVWKDRRTLLRVFSAQQPVMDGGVQSVELRTSEEIYRRGALPGLD